MVQSYRVRRALCVGLALFVAVMVDRYFSFSREGWVVLTAFLVCQTTRGTPLKQSMMLFIVVAVVAVLFPAQSMEVMRDRLIDVVIGALLGMLFGQIIFRVNVYAEFALGVVPLLKALKQYSNQSDWQIQEALTSKNKLYPEWVFEVGFNPGLRAGFRFFLIQLERVTEIYFSTNYLMKRGMDEGLLMEFTPLMSDVAKKNDELLQAIIDYFSGLSVKATETDYTSDVAELEKVLNSFIPGSLELLDMSPDYMTLTALVRNLKDTRELLLQLVTALP